MDKRIVLLVVLLLLFFSWRTVSPSESDVYNTACRYSDALLWFDSSASADLSMGDALTAARMASSSPAAQMTSEIAGDVFGLWRTVVSERVTSDEAEIVFLQSCDRIPKFGGSPRTIHDKITMHLKKNGGAWKVSSFEREDGEGKMTLTHRIRQLTAYRKGRPASSK